MLRAHQAEAVLRSFRPGAADGRNVIVTSGTGSGKTESFLLPVLLRLVEESASWTPQPGAAPLVDGPRRHLAAQAGAARPAPPRSVRWSSTQRTRLVEDQMIRLRRGRAPHRRGRRAEQALVRPVHRQHAGRCHDAGGREGRRRSSTPPSSYRRWSRSTTHSRRRARTQEDLAQFADPRAHEMLTRWDMIAAPPDVLVTNYSMLNAMLMREVEQPMFDATARWLRASAANVLTLVVDELHLYRGTQGSEVAMVIRNLLMRLGLEPDSPQLRVIGTSASLAGHDEGLRYLQEFFGVPRASFAVVPGKTRGLGEPVRLDRAAILAGRDRTPPPFRRLNSPGRSRWPAGTRTEGRFRATPLGDISRRLFGDDDDGAATRAVLETIAAAESAPGSVPLRAHLFVRMVRGMWACANPACTGVPDADRHDRTIGRLLAVPASTCPDCGSRVLELLYCYECGDVSLGGYVVERPEEGGFVLGPTAPDIPALEAQPIGRRRYGQYMWYWPGKRAHPARSQLDQDACPTASRRRSASGRSSLIPRSAC